MSLESLREEVLRRARARAEALVKEAEGEARRILEEARRDYSRRYELVKGSELRELRDELSKKVSEKSMELNMELLKLKNGLVSDLMDSALKTLHEVPEDLRRESLKRLIKECVEGGLPEQGIRLRVVERDSSLVKEVVRELRLEDRVTGVELLPPKYVGGVFVEFGNGSLGIDNTYLTRLERVAPHLYRRLREEVFGD
ncbi:MAG: V-type ATP synthase subunit E family protein [Zestosphaera sp.]